MKALPEFDEVLELLEQQVRESGVIALDTKAAAQMLTWLSSIQEVIRQQNVVLTLLRAERETGRTHVGTKT